MARSVGLDRAQVVAAAAALADEYGFEQVTLAQVAKQVGVQLPSLYNHINGLAGLRDALALLALHELLAVVRNAAVGRSGAAAVIAVAQAYRAYVLAHPGRYAATVRAPASDAHEYRQTAQATIDVFLAILAPYGFDDQQAIHAMRGLRSIVHGFATLELAGGFGIALDRDQSFERLLQTYVAGLEEGRREETRRHGDTGTRRHGDTV